MFIDKFGRCYDGDMVTGDREASQLEIAAWKAPITPSIITALQGLLALDHGGLASYYEAWASAPERTFAQKAFINKALTWRRDDPTLNAAAVDLGLTQAQVDTLFSLAATL